MDGADHFASRLGTVMIFLRSLIFNATFYVALILFLIVFSPVLLMPRIYAIRALQLWGRSANWLMTTICQIEIEVRGRENIPPGPILVAAKHQSMLETFALVPLFANPTYVMKSQIKLIPIFGQYTIKAGMIHVDREGGTVADNQDREQHNQRGITCNRGSHRVAPGDCCGWPVVADGCLGVNSLSGR